MLNLYFHGGPKNYVWHDTIPLTLCFPFDVTNTVPRSASCDLLTYTIHKVWEGLTKNAVKFLPLLWQVSEALSCSWSAQLRSCQYIKECLASLLAIKRSAAVKRLTRARICKPFKEPRNRFPAWWAGTTYKLGVPRTGPPDYVVWRNRFDRFLGSLNVYKYGLCFHATFEYVVIRYNQYITMKYSSPASKGQLRSTHMYNSEQYIQKVLNCCQLAKFLVPSWGI